MRDAAQRERLADDLRIGGEIVLPIPVSQNYRRLGRRAETWSARQRHADRLEVVRGDEHYLFGLLLEVNLPVRPTENRDSRIGSAQISVVRIGPCVRRLARPQSSREDFDQSIRLYAGRR